MNYRTVPIVIAIALLSACAPQAELVKTRTDLNDVRGDLRSIKAELQDIQGIRSRLDALDQGMKGTSDLQVAIADYGVRFDQITTDLQILQGRLEENNYKLAEIGQKLDDKTYKIAELTARVEELEEKLKAGVGGASAGQGAGDKKQETRMPEPSEAYRQAKADYDKGNYDLAAAGFQNYLKQFPDASQAPSAQYWIGECYYAKKDYGRAIDEFGKVLKNHAKSDKAPGARLKIGYSYLNEKNTAKAREHLNKVIRDYPHSKEADLAKEKLHKIGK